MGGSLVNNVLSVIPKLGAKCGRRDDKDQFCLQEPEQVSMKKTAGWALMNKQGITGGESSVKRRRGQRAGGREGKCDLRMDWGPKQGSLMPS